LVQNPQHPSYGLRIHAPYAEGAVAQWDGLGHVGENRQSTVLLAEELAFVTIDPESGRRVNGRSSHLGPCLAGLFLGELLIEGLAKPGKHADTVLLTGRAAPEGSTLAVVARVLADKGPKIKPVLSSMDRGLREQIGLDTWGTAALGLVEAGLLTPLCGEGGLRYKVLARSAHSAVSERLRAAASGKGKLDVRTALLLSMMTPAGLLPLVAPDRRERPCARKRIDHVLDGSQLKPIGKLTRTLAADTGELRVSPPLSVVS
jgi:hypothetical protein